MVPRTARTWL